MVIADILKKEKICKVPRSTTLTLVVFSIQIEL